MATAAGSSEPNLTPSILELLAHIQTIAREGDAPGGAEAYHALISKAMNSDPAMTMDLIHRGEIPMSSLPPRLSKSEQRSVGRGTKKELKEQRRLEKAREAAAAAALAGASAAGNTTPR